MARLRDLGLATLLLISAAGFGLGIGLIVNEHIVPNVYGQGASYTAGNVLTAGAALPGTCTVGALYSLTVSPFTLNQCRATDVWSAVGTGSGGDWNTYIVKSVNQDVTASSTLVNDTELFFTVGAGETWHIELIMAYSGDAFATDMKLQATFPSSYAVYQQLHRTYNANTATFTTLFMNGTTQLTEAAMGTGSVITSYMTASTIIELAPASGGTFQVQHANFVSGVTRMASGSILRAKRIH